MAAIQEHYHLNVRSIVVTLVNPAEHQTHITPALRNNNGQVSPSKGEHPVDERGNPAPEPGKTAPVKRLPATAQSEPAIVQPVVFGSPMSGAPSVDRTNGNALFAPPISPTGPVVALGSPTWENATSAPFAAPLPRPKPVMRTPPVAAVVARPIPYSPAFRAPARIGPAPSPGSRLAQAIPPAYPRLFSPPNRVAPSYRAAPTGFVPPPPPHMSRPQPTGPITRPPSIPATRVPTGAHLR